MSVLKLNITSKNEHVPEAERAIRLVKERTRCVRHTLPFKAVPRSMVAAIVLFCALRGLMHFLSKEECPLR